MNSIEEKVDNATTKKYLALISIISRMENRLGWSELVYLSLNIFVFLFIVNFVSPLLRKSSYALTHIDLVLIFFCLVIGIFINAYWVAFAMRMQLKLKLRYFQVRFLERKLNCIGECIFSDESIFFDPDIRHLESPDNKEILKYPTSGLTRMDGFIGAAKPRLFSWIMPCLFIAIYWLIFLWVLPNIY